MHRIVLLPGDRYVYALPASGEGEWRRVELPGFSIGREPLMGPAHLFAKGPYLVVSYEGGVETFASLTTLQDLARTAADPLERAALLIQAGNLRAAIEILGPLAANEQLAEDERAQHGWRVLGLVRDVVLAMATHAARDDALALMDRAKGWLPTRDLMLQWQLLKLETFQTLREPASVERAQDILYEMMEGKR